MKKQHIIITVLLMVLTSSINAFASAESTPKEYLYENFHEADFRTAIITEYASKISINQSSVNYSMLYNWDSSISYFGNGRFSLSGYTEAFFNVDSISTIVYLQRYNTLTKTWTNINSFSNIQNNTYYSSASNSYTVEKGQSYRVYAIHTVKKGATTETEFSYSQSILAF